MTPDSLDTIAYRCIRHFRIPPYNRNEPTGAECPECEMELLRTRLSELEEREKRLVAKLVLWGHRCKRLARAYPMGEGRDWWIGTLLEPIPEYPQETHCLHLVTPLKSAVFAFTVADLDILTALFYSAKGRHTSPEWVESQASAYEARAALAPADSQACDVATEKR